MKIFAGDEYRFTREAVAIEETLERLSAKSAELLQLADALEGSGKPVSAHLVSQLHLVRFLDSLNRGKWGDAREHCLTLSELLPDFPPSLRLALR